MCACATALVVVERANHADAACATASETSATKRAELQVEVTVQQNPLRVVVNRNGLVHHVENAGYRPEHPEIWLASRSRRVIPDRDVFDLVPTVAARVQTVLCATMVDCKECGASAPPPTYSPERSVRDLFATLCPPS